MRIFLIFSIPLLLISCFGKKHKFDKIEVSELVSNEGEHPYSRISYCLKDEIGYSTYYVDFSIVTKDNQTFDGQDEIIGGSNSKEKCFEFVTNSMYSGLVKKYSPPERYREVAKIYRSNLKSIKFSIHEERSNEILDEITITHFE